MGEVIKLNIIDRPQSDGRDRHFALQAHGLDGGWRINVTDFYDHGRSEAGVFREIAECLIPIAGGMIHSAEEVEATPRGKVICNINIYADGTVDLITAPMKTAKQKSWFRFILTSVIRDITGTKRGKH